MGRAGEDLVQRPPEAESAVAVRDLGRDRQPAPLHVDEQLPPALGALAHTHLEPDELLLALGRRPDQHEHAVCLLGHPRLQIDAVSPDVGVAARQEIAALPAGVLIRPRRRKPGDDGRRQVQGVAPQQGCQRLLEVAGRDAAQVQDRQQRVQAAGAPRPLLARARMKIGLANLTYNMNRAVWLTSSRARIT